MHSKWATVKKAFDLVDVFYDGKQVGEFIRDVDGYFMFFPNNLEGKMYNNGGYTSQFLLELSEELVKLNKTWDDSVREFFKK